MTTSAEIRNELIDALRLDLIGPDPDDLQHDYEEIDGAPSRWYLSGFIVPYDAKLDDRSDPSADDDFHEPANSRNDDDAPPEPQSARKSYFPSSMGLSFLLDDTTTQLNVTVTWGDYESRQNETVNPTDNPTDNSTDSQTDGDNPAKNTLRDTSIWHRTPRREYLTITIPNRGKAQPIAIPHSDGLELSLSVSPIANLTNNHLPANTRAVSLFLVNHRKPAEGIQSDHAFAFQTALTATTPDSSAGFIPRPDPRGQGERDDFDEKIADLQYRDSYEFAIGHNVSAWADRNTHGQCYAIGTAWIPRANVKKVVPAPADRLGLTDDNLELDRLAAVPDLDSLHDRLRGLTQNYADWIATQQASIQTETQNRQTVAQDLLHRAHCVRKRIEDGIASLSDPHALEAFRIANRAIATAIRQRASHRGTDPDHITPRWRPFQLAFILTNLRGIVDPTHPDREIVDLLFFPTGGGKTEAYLGLAAFTIALRRLRDPSITSAGLSVLMRYTLRLLTLDQLGRAATLICALELERQANPDKLGHWPIEIGLWVGMSATPNRLGKKGDNSESTARYKVRQHINPLPLETCPWCGEKFSKSSFRLFPNDDAPTRLTVTCSPDRSVLRTESRSPRSCQFRRQSLPLLAIDETLYRRLPAFIIATVDKFANLPWVGETAALFGKVTHYQPELGFCSTADPKPNGQPLPNGLLPPDLIIQDELHLISGPLGTMVGLYETAIDYLSSHIDPATDRRIRPKIVASTATVRRAQSQIKALFARNEVEIFPPPGPDRHDSFFAVTSNTANPRTYLGIAAQGRSLKVVLLRVYLALLGAAQTAWEREGSDRAAAGHKIVDPYMTLLGYFNALRELGGSRRIVEDEVNSRLRNYAQRKRRNEEFGSFRDRTIEDVPCELTSRVNTADVAKTKRRLEQPFSSKDRVDVALATNMISVGLDIDRLGLMVVLGQPKTAAEYIQSTSRVGRDDRRPGLVITLLNVHRPRDRSHYEHFTAWHDAFYRAVEATSVTPFSSRALDRGLAGVTVSLARLGDAKMTPALGAGNALDRYQDLAFVVDELEKRSRQAIDPHSIVVENADIDPTKQTVRSRTQDLLKIWSQEASEHQSELQYQREVGGARPLLRNPLEPDGEGHKNFKAQRSLRDVEPTVNLWLQTPE